MVASQRNNGSKAENQKVTGGHGIAWGGGFKTRANSIFAMVKRKGANPLAFRYLSRADRTAPLQKDQKRSNSLTREESRRQGNAPLHISPVPQRIAQGYHIPLKQILRGGNP